ncbi:hypothetical protein SAMN05216229_114109 [Geopseudomonas sagittaria]|uniref:Uncharacterized protein n=1 Tax=Geopseudomonas sagittaria TaxID=1135990 RepID=A0A1I5WZE9_9GAMM|nr:hypothetical protein [Pseudomonas sagittaria]SFQ24877.1 hypothetical protein SAMN05216229_114109 [Pseudomonas sagittaria]
MSDEQYRHESLSVLREIRDTQREILAQLGAQRALAEEQLARSRETVEESIGLQKLALQRQRAISLVAVPGILACIAAIGYLVLRYF